jgi:hypothetical protein
MSHNWLVFLAKFNDFYYKFFLNIVDTPVAGPGTAGRFTRETGFLGNIYLIV